MPIEVKDVSYLYEAGTPFEKEALSHVSLTIEQGEFIGLIGHTGLSLIHISEPTRPY